MDIKAVINNYMEIVTKKYFCFTGRADRKSFWMFVLVNFVISFVLGLIPGVGKFLPAVYSLVVLCPSLGVTCRRLHDTGKSGWLQLIALIPVGGVIIVLIMCAQPAKDADNKFGEADA